MVGALCPECGDRLCSNSELTDWYRAVRDGSSLRVDTIAARPNQRRHTILARPARCQSETADRCNVCEGGAIDWVQSVPNLSGFRHGHNCRPVRFRAI